MARKATSTAPVETSIILPWMNGPRSLTTSTLWAGRGTLRFFPFEIEEHLPLAPLEILGAYHFSSGYSFPGGEVLHRWV
jgi:hypothetical protein